MACTYILRGIASHHAWMCLCTLAACRGSCLAELAGTLQAFSACYAYRHRPGGHRARWRSRWQRYPCRAAAGTHEVQAEATLAWHADTGSVDEVVLQMQDILHASTDGTGEHLPPRWSVVMVRLGAWACVGSSCGVAVAERACTGLQALLDCSKVLACRQLGAGCDLEACDAMS